MNNENSNNNTREMLVDRHFDNMDNVERARNDYFRKSNDVVQQYNDMPLNHRDRLEMGNLIERKRVQDEILADNIVQANAVYDNSRNPNADSYEDDINQGAERAILDDMRYHKETVKDLINEMEEITGNNLTRNPDSSNTLRELHEKMEHSSQRYNDWITRSEMTLDQYHDIDNPNTTQDNTTQPDLPVPAEFSDFDSNSESGSYSSEESSVMDDSDADSNSVAENPVEEVAEQITEQVTQEVREEVREGSSDWVTTDWSSEESSDEVAGEKVTEQVTENIVPTTSSNNKRKRDDSEDFEEEIDVNPRKRLNVMEEEEKEKEEEKNVEVVVEPAQSSSATTTLASSSRKRKRDDSEGIEEDKPQEKKEKTSLLDDFADTSTEPADYFGGDD